MNTPQNDQEQTSFPNRLAVLAWLKGNGWKISKSGIYTHCQEGKLRPDPDGTYTLTAVERYARTFLKRLSTGQKIKPELDKLQRDKAEAETKRATAQAEHWELKIKIAKGLYVEYAQYEQDLAARITILKSDMENFARSSAGEIIQCVGGDPSKIPDLIDMLLARVRSWLGRYAEDKEFIVPVTHG